MQSFPYRFCSLSTGQPSPAFTHNFRWLCQGSILEFPKPISLLFKSLGFMLHGVPSLSELYRHNNVWHLISVLDCYFHMSICFGHRNIKILAHGEFSRSIWSLSKHFAYAFLHSCHNVKGVSILPGEHNEDTNSWYPPAPVLCAPYKYAKEGGRPDRLLWNASVGDILHKILVF